MHVRTNRHTIKQVSGTPLDNDLFIYETPHRVSLVDTPTGRILYNYHTKEELHDNLSKVLPHIEYMRETKEYHDQIIVGTDVPFERIRRITGYLVGSLNRFNNAKRAEVNDRVTHQ